MDGQKHGHMTEGKTICLSPLHGGGIKNAAYCHFLLVAHSKVLFYIENVLYLKQYSHTLHTILLLSNQSIGNSSDYKIHFGAKFEKLS